MKESSVIVLELNELTPHLMHQWIADGKLPGFKRLHDQASVFITDAEEPTESLEPWIQWVTVHSGLTFTEHGIYDLGEGHKLQAPRLWDVVSNAGKRVLICGSMNAGIFGENVNGKILPDPWSTGLKPFPEKDLKDFFRYIQTSVREYTRSDSPLTLKDHLRFGLFMLRNGLSVATVRLAAKQLVSEQLTRKSHWRRAMILDRLMWDYFRSGWRREKPHYSTLFLNSSAHMQHYYWRNMDPSAFTIKPSEAEQNEYHNAILLGYQAMDRIVLEALQLVQGTNTSLVMMTALSQQPLNSYDESGGKLLFKAIDQIGLQRFAGIGEPGKYEPVMAEEFRLKFATVEAAQAAQAKIMGVTMNGQPIMRSRQDGTELFMACAIISQPAENTTVVSSTGTDARFSDLFYPLETIKSGRHHPDGMFWVRSPEREHRIINEKIPLRTTTATLAALAGLDDATINHQFVPSPPVQETAGTSQQREEAPT